MNSTLSREARWLFDNIVVLLAYLYGFAIVQAIVLLALSSDGTIAPGWWGNPIEQIVGWAMVAGWVAAFVGPLMVVVLVPYRILVRVVGRPRAVASAIAGIGTLVAWLLVPDIDGPTLGVLGILCFGYAAVLRLPGRSLAELSPWLRGAIIGIAFSLVWILGSLVGIVWGSHRAAQGRKVEGGAIAVASTIVPGMMLFADLFREGVPETNYVVTALLLGGSALGLWFLVNRSAVGRSHHRAAATDVRT